MKIINYICRIFALILSLGAVVLFFFPFVTMQVGSEAIDATGAQLAFGTTVTTANASYNLAHSVYMLLSIILAALSAITAGVSLGVKKSVGARVVSFLSALIGGIIMLVAALSSVAKFTDYRPVPLDAAAVKALSYSPLVLIIAVMLFACAVIGIIGWLVNDYLEVLASKGQKLTVWQRVKKFLREMVAEIKKIVWPNYKSVIRNSVIVLILCLLLGAFIWIADFILGYLVDLITKL